MIPLIIGFVVSLVTAVIATATAILVPKLVEDCMSADGVVENEFYRKTKTEPIEIKANFEMKRPNKHLQANISLKKGDFEPGLTGTSREKNLSPRKRKAFSNTRNGSDYYNMSSKLKGMCLIINNVKFKNVKETRRGSDTDADGLKALFTWLGFEVIMKRNQTAEEMKTEINSFTSYDHTKMNAAILFILSHGGEGDCIYGTDNKSLSLRDIVDAFNNKNCSTLRDKPKVIFTQACRGGRKDFATDSDLTDQPSLYRYQSDTFVVQSTLPDFVSWRDPENGSLFVQAIVKVFRKRAMDISFPELMAKVDKRIYEITNNGTRQQATSVLWQGVTKTLHFNPPD